MANVSLETLSNFIAAERRLDQTIMARPHTAAVREWVAKATDEDINALIVQLTHVRAMAATLATMEVSLSAPKPSKS